MIEKYRFTKSALFLKKITFYFKGSKASTKDYDYYGFDTPAIYPLSRSRPASEFVTLLNKKRPCLFGFVTLALMMFFVFPSSVFAHRGAVDEVDPCRIRVGFEKIHFTAYTPTISPGREYCNVIPNLGSTNLVFDYEGKKLRDVTVEFEVTKEPEGTRVFYQEPKKIKTGTVNGLVDFSKYGAGDYLVHVAIVHEGKKLDTHLPLSVGIDDDSGSAFIDFLIWVVAGLLIIFVMIWLAKGKEDQTASP